MARIVKEVSLCPECCACPSVKIQLEEDAAVVTIGEGENTVRLTGPAWNELVRAVRRGELTEIE